jgi:hypothetical protein
MKWTQATQELPPANEDVLVQFAGIFIMASYDTATKRFIDKMGRVCPVAAERIQWARLSPVQSGSYHKENV